MLRVFVSTGMGASQHSPLDTHSTCYSSVIQDICSRFEDCIPSPIYATLAVLTIIGVVLSLIGIIATIVTLLLFK